MTNREAFENARIALEKILYVLCIDLTTVNINSIGLLESYIRQARQPEIDALNARIDHLGESLHKSDLEQHGYAITIAMRDAEIERLKAEIAEQCRIIGAGGERELALMAKIDAKDADIARLQQATIKSDNTQALYNALAEIERLKRVVDSLILTGNDLGLSHSGDENNPYVCFHPESEHSHYKPSRIWHGNKGGFIDSRATFAAIDKFNAALDAAEKESL